ncbi:hypothetical protein DFH07DRAFT_346029 [Mycena maculata]|uniref:Uncharacterized protein n=1 Tax=Mycena maculata TaxID=230809 RepID=A0AAD7HC13_9AGAR|nr:hypothetical protein DFH07DRAFT_346029 [Mycena maculata]
MALYRSFGHPSKGDPPPEPSGSICGFYSNFFPILPCCFQLRNELPASFRFRPGAPAPPPIFCRNLPRSHHLSPSDVPVCVRTLRSKKTSGINFVNISWLVVRSGLCPFPSGFVQPDHHSPFHISLPPWLRPWLPCIPVPDSSFRHLSLLCIFWSPYKTLSASFLPCGLAVLRLPLALRTFRNFRSGFPRPDHMLQVNLWPARDFDKGS